MSDRVVGGWASERPSSGWVGGGWVVGGWVSSGWVGE